MLTSCDYSQLILLLVHRESSISIWSLTAIPSSGLQKQIRETFKHKVRRADRCIVWPSASWEPSVLMQRSCQWVKMQFSFWKKGKKQTFFLSFIIILLKVLLSYDSQRLFEKLKQTNVYHVLGLYLTMHLHLLISLTNSFFLSSLNLSSTLILEHTFSYINQIFMKKEIELKFLDFFFFFFFLLPVISVTIFLMV